MTKFQKPPYSALPGVISATALEEHLRLYSAYVDKANGGIEPFEYNLAGAVLHELYFSQLSLKPQTLSLPILRGIITSTRQWSTVDAFWRDFRAAAMEARGWALLSARSADDGPRIIVLNKHNGAVPDYETLIAIDCYEHAYYMDYGTRKGEYLDAVWKALDWVELERRWARVRHQL